MSLIEKELMPKNIRKTNIMRNTKKIAGGEVTSSLRLQRSVEPYIRVVFIFCLVNTELQVNINVNHSENLPFFRG